PCTITPAPGYQLAQLTDNLVDVTSQVVSNTYSVTNVTAPRSIAATFSNSLGTPCGSNADCGSSVCVDGVCCGTACTGQCEACDITACKTICAVDGDCASGNYCDSTSACVPQKAQATACGADNECLSANCADGVCCDRACGGQCEACDVTGSVGTCSPATGAP